MRLILQRYFSLILSFAIVLGLAPMLSNTTAQASSGYAYKWTLRFDFDDSFNGELYVEAGRNDGSGGVQQPPLYRQAFVVPCGTSGAVNLAGGVAQFNGGFLKCRLNLEAAIDTVLNGCQSADPNCAIPVDDIEKYVTVKLGADLNTPAMTFAPIFSHNNTAFGVDVGSATHGVRASFAPIGEINSSPWPAIPPTGVAHSHSASFGCTEFMDCGVHFLVAGAAEYVDTADTLAEFQIAESVFYIGRDFAGTTIAAGSQLDNIFVDPGNGFPD